MKTTWAEVQSVLADGELRIYHGKNRIHMGPIDTVTVSEAEIIFTCCWMVESNNDGETWHTIDAKPVVIPLSVEPFWFNSVGMAFICDLTWSTIIIRITINHTDINWEEEGGVQDTPSLCGND